MIGQEIKLILKDNKAYLTSSKSLLLDQLGLPPIAKSFSSPAFWKVKILNHSPKKIYVDVISYHVGETQFSYVQKSLFDELNAIEIIAFKSIDTDGLLRTLKGQKPGTFIPEKYESVCRSTTNYFNEIPPKYFPIKKVIKENFLISLKNVLFEDGCVKIIKKFKNHIDPIELCIPNNDLKKEFEAVKNYFANVLKSKKIRVSCNIVIEDGRVISSTAQSPEIEKINTDFIDDVKISFVKSMIKKKSFSKDAKTIYTFDEQLDSQPERNVNPNIFYKKDIEFLEDLIQISGTKHFNHLKYLSKLHAHKIMKLRFVHSPFSFIFLFEGNKKYHIIWETLDTEEATYIWHIEKNKQVLKQAVKRIEDIINVIKAKGKKDYLNSSDDSFSRVYHDYSELVDGFLKWENELKSVLQ
ncbi:MAG: hypothetical protein AB7W47_13650 [Calditrichaceae bacterium]